MDWIHAAPLLLVAGLSAGVLLEHRLAEPRIVYREVIPPLLEERILALRAVVNTSRP